jgi:hypothetical protein
MPAAHAASQAIMRATPHGHWVFCGANRAFKGFVRINNSYFEFILGCFAGKPRTAAAPPVAVQAGVYLATAPICSGLRAL